MIWVIEISITVGNNNKVRVSEHRHNNMSAYWSIEVGYNENGLVITNSSPNLNPIIRDAKYYDMSQ